MPTIYSIKPYFQRLLRPLLVFLVRMGVTANQVTLFALFISVGFGIYFLWVGREIWYLMPAVFLVRMALNAIDGMIAKEFQMQSRLGVYLNEMGDMISDIFLYLPFVLVFPCLTLLFCCLSLFSEVAGVLATAIQEKRRYDGPMGKSDRAFCLGILGFFMAFYWISNFLGAILLGFLSILVSLTIFFRIKNALIGGR